jgi:hypothetical protein
MGVLFSYIEDDILVLYQPSSKTAEGVYPQENNGTGIGAK